MDTKVVKDGDISKLKERMCQLIPCNVKVWQLSYRKRKRENHHKSHNSIDLLFCLIYNLYVLSLGHHAERVSSSILLAQSCRAHTGVRFVGGLLFQWLVDVKLWLFGRHYRFCSEHKCVRWCFRYSAWVEHHQLFLSNPFENSLN